MGYSSCVLVYVPRFTLTFRLLLNSLLVSFRGITTFSNCITGTGNCCRGEGDAADFFRSSGVSRQLYYLKRSQRALIKHWAAPPSDVDITTRQTDRPAGWQAGRQIDRQTDRLHDKARRGNRIWRHSSCRFICPLVFLIFTASLTSLFVASPPYTPVTLILKAGGVLSVACTVST